MANSERSISFATRKRESRNLCQKPKLNANLAMAVGARSGWQSRQSTNCGLGFAERALRFRTLSKSFPATASSAPFSFSGFKRFGLYNDMLKSVPEVVRSRSLIQPCIFMRCFATRETSNNQPSFIESPLESCCDYVCAAN